MKRWNINQISESDISSISDGTDLSGLASHVLAARGIKTAEQAREFLWSTEISDPFLIADMEKAVEIIKAALYKGEKIVIFGDYDCDGVTSTVMLCQYLSAQGGEADWYIPSRDEGYGLNITAIDELAEKGANLIITVDNGISSIPEAAYIKERGIKLIITDHHSVPEILPEADAIINPKRPGDLSPFKELAGCGVVLKLIMALEGDTEGVMEQFSDLAALGTIGDVVPILGENRVIVRRGLEVMPYTENIGLYKLLRQSGLLSDDGGERLTAGALSFTACPRINAAGRFSHAKKAAELLLSESEELAEIRAAELTELNNARRDAENDIISQTDLFFCADPARLSERVLVLNGENWHNGVIGIVSSRLLTKWGKPNIVISDDGQFIRGSARSIEGFPLMPLLDRCKAYLEKYGGHVKAAGFTAKADKLPAIINEIKNYCAENFPQMPPDIITADKILKPEDLSLESVEGLRALRPFGESNPVPVFMMQNCEIVSKRPLKDGKYLSFNVKTGNVIQKVLNFSQSYSDFRFREGDKIDVLVTLDINEYNGTRSVSAQMKDVRPVGFNQDRHFAALRAYESLRRGEEIDVKLAARALPEKEDVKVIYDILRRNGADKNNSADVIYAEVSAKGVNYCKFRVILDVLSEFKLIEYDIVKGTVKLLPACGKADLESSLILNKMKALAAH